MQLHKEALALVDKQLAETLNQKLRLETALKNMRAFLEPMGRQIICPADNMFTKLVASIDNALKEAGCDPFEQREEMSVCHECWKFPVLVLEGKCKGCRGK